MQHAKTTTKGKIAKEQRVQTFHIALIVDHSVQRGESDSFQPFACE